MAREREDKTKRGSPKRPYHRPRLLVYGDINEITRSRSVFGGTVLDGMTIMTAFGTFKLKS